MIIISEVCKYLSTHADFLGIILRLISEILSSQISLTIPLIDLFVIIQQSILTEPPLQGTIFSFIITVPLQSHLLQQPVEFMRAVEGEGYHIRICLMYCFKCRIQIFQGVKLQSQFIRNILTIHETRSLCQDFRPLIILIRRRESTAYGIEVTICCLIDKLINRIYLKVHLRILFLQLIQRVADLGIRQILITVRADDIRHISGGHHQRQLVVIRRPDYLDVYAEAVLKFLRNGAFPGVVRPPCFIDEHGQCGNLSGIRRCCV